MVLPPAPESQKTRMKNYYFIWSGLIGNERNFDKVIFRTVCDRPARVGRNINEDVRNVEEGVQNVLECVLELLIKPCALKFI